MSNSKYSNISSDFANLLPRFRQKFIHHLILPIPPNHFFTLVSLCDYGTQSITELSHRLLISKQQMSPIIEKLIQSNYVERQIDPDDKRSAKISITPLGYNILESHHENIKELIEKKIEPLNAQDLDNLSQTLHNLTIIINKLS